MTSDVELYLGDCMEVLRDLPDGSADAVITDPPYSSGDLERGEEAPLLDEVARRVQALAELDERRG